MNSYDFSRWGAPKARPSFWFRNSVQAILLLASVIIGLLWLIPVQSIQARPDVTHSRVIWTGAEVVTQQLTGGGSNSNWTKNEDYFVINLDPVVPQAELIRVEIASQPIPGVTVLANNAYSATTDSTGHYTLTQLVTGSYTLSPTFSTTQTNAVFVPPVRVVEITSGMTMTRLITGQDFVRWHRYPVTGLITGELITEAVVSAYQYPDWQATRAEVGASGHYTFASLLAGRYSFTATHADYQFVSEDPLVRDVFTDTVGPTFRQIDSSGMYTISGRVTEYGSDTPIAEVSISIQDGTTTTTDVTGYYTFTDLAEGTYNLTATGQGFTFKPKVAEIVLTRDRGDVKQDFEGESIIIPNIPKGANFLSFDNIADDANHNVGWNLDQIRHVIDYENLRANITSSSANPSNQSSLVTTGGVVSGTLAGGMRFDGVTGGRKYVYVYDDLIVPEGETLIIPGDTDIVFESDYRIIVAGQFLADRWGDVLFTTHSSRGWNGIHFLPTSSGSRCVRCRFENLAEGATSLEVEAPITLIEGRISGITNGIAISSTVPFTMSNISIDHAKTGLHLSGPLTQSYTFNHLTIADCEQGIINQGQSLTLENSIIANCDEGIRTEQSGDTNVRYSLFYNEQNFVTTGTLQIGPGMLYTAPLFQKYHLGDLPGSYHLSEGSPGIDAADPQADYSKEPRFSGDRADMGAWGNTGYATYRIPYEKMGLALSATPLTQTGHLGDVVTFTVMLTNTGEMTQEYNLSVVDYIPYALRNNSVRTSFTATGETWNWYEDYSSLMLSPQEHKIRTIWSRIPLTLHYAITSHRLKVHASNTFMDDDVYLKINIPHVKEEKGQLYLEAEEYMRQTPAITSTASWITQSIITGYVGSGYVTALPDTGLEITTPLSSPLNQGGNGEYDSPKLSYTIHFTTPGRYHVWLRGYAADNESDAVYVALDNQPAQLMTGFPKMRWSWWHKNQVDTPVTIAIPKDETGLHTFNIWMAEDGFRLDRILLTLEGDYIPAGRGPTKGEGNQAHLLSPAVGGFETGTLVGWELPYPGVTLAEGSAYQDQYGLKLNGRGRLDYSFETIPGTTYQVSAWVRLDEVISPPSWGGLLLQAVDIPSWHQLGWSAYLHAGSHPYGQTLPLGEWHYVTFSFEAVGSTSRIVYQNFSNGELVASADEFQVLPLAEPSLLARSSRLLRRGYTVHLPVVRGGTGLSEAMLADRLLAWERAWASGQQLDLPVELARVYGVGD